VRFDPGIVLRDAGVRVGVKAATHADVAVLLSLLMADTWRLLRHIAYFLATVQWETAGTFRPIRERRARDGRIRELQDRYWHTGFYGRGYVQLTWERNYRKASQALYGDTRLVTDPDLLLLPTISYAVASQGMRVGWFTGKKLDDYITEGQPPDYLNARRIINRMDRAETIAGLASGWELVLRAAQEIAA
jgi:hypothetical protein